MYSKSEILFQKACQLMPGGVNSPVRACKNVHASPLFVERAKGAHLWDVDGNEYIDFVLSWGPLLLGHANPQVTEAIREAASMGSSFGAPCPAEVELAELVTQALPGVEMLRMVNSGTEATMSALRLARGFTGKNKFIKFAGCYHGHADPFLAAAGSGVATFEIQGTPGVPASVAADTLLAPYNDLEAVEKIFAQWPNQIAAIIVEPVAANMGLVLPVAGFLEGLRKLATENGTVLIFDEVITGFRLSFGGAQKYYNITPDLTTLGKIIGGGLPVGCFGGKKEIMKHIAPDGEVYQAGTLSGNPLAMASGIAALKQLALADYDSLAAQCRWFARELHAILNKKAAVQVPSIASMFGIFFSEEPVTNFEKAKKCNQNLYEKFYHQMRSQGIYMAPSAFETGMLSFAHTDRDYEQTLEAAGKVAL